VSEDVRGTLDELATEIRTHLGRRLLGLYVFGSLAAGGFHEGRSDLDLVAVLDSDVADGADLDSLRALHDAFEAARPEWRDRVEVLYVSHAVLGSFASVPSGSVARVSPGEPLHQRDLGGDISWLLDWHGVVTGGETLFGPPPLTLGPDVSNERFRAAVVSQLKELRDVARHKDVAYVPVHQGYIVATVCRALYSLETGRQTSKSDAVEWAADRFPEQAEFIVEHYAAYRADVWAAQRRVIEFVDAAVERAEVADARGT
jgi:predicted nucleotidyltransferase